MALLKIETFELEGSMFRKYCIILTHCKSTLMNICIPPTFINKQTFQALMG